MYGRTASGCLIRLPRSDPIRNRKSRTRPRYNCAACGFFWWWQPPSISLPLSVSTPGKEVMPYGDSAKVPTSSHYAEAWAEDRPCETSQKVEAQACARQV